MQASACMSIASEVKTCRLKPARRSERGILISDEFAALLDRVTAAIVARCLRRAISASDNLGAIVATSHEDLMGALAPDTIIHCDFREIEVSRRKT
jgi:ABC-type ATPase with predicted acetyltransferase domain